MLPVHLPQLRCPFSAPRQCFSVYMALQKKHPVISKISNASQHSSGVKKTLSLLSDISTAIKYNDLVAKQNTSMPVVDDLVLQEKQFSTLPKWQELCFELNKQTKEITAKDILEGEDPNTSALQLNFDALIPTRIRRDFLSRLEQWKKDFQLETIPTEHILKCFISTDQLSHLLLETPLLSSGNSSTTESINSKASFPIQQVLWHSNRELIFEGNPLVELILTMYLVRQSNGAAAGSLSHLRTYLTHPSTIKYVCENSLQITESWAEQIFEFDPSIKQEDESYFAKKAILVQGFNFESIFFSIVATVQRNLGMQQAIQFVNQYFLPQALMYITSSISNLDAKDTQSLLNDLNTLETKMLVLDYEAEVTKLVQQQYFCKPEYKILRRQAKTETNMSYVVMGLFARNDLLQMAMGSTEEEAKTNLNKLAFDKFVNK